MTKRQWQFIGAVVIAVAVTTGIIVVTQEQQQALVDALLGFIR